MLKRPSSTDTEDDLLKQQEEFHKTAGKNFKSAKNETPIVKEKLDKPFGIIGDVIERSLSDFSNETSNENTENGFPKLFNVSELGNTAKVKTKRKSLFAQRLTNTFDTVKMLENPPKINVFVRSDSGLHNENLEKLKAMSHEEIMEEKQKLESTLNPDLIKFLKNRKTKNVECETKIPSKREESIQEVKIDVEDIKSNISKCIDQQWLEMDKIEPEKLKWIGDIPDASALESGKEYSARFDFKGDLQPFKKTIDVTTSLHHHGQEPERPGYTIQELYQLSRSTVLQQRILALKTLANIVRKTKMGYYDSCFDGALLKKLVESDVFFLLRFAMDDRATTAAAVNCLNEFFVSKSDEVCLDRLRNWPGHNLEPFLFVQIETDKDSEEEELKDNVIISQDLIKGVLRTDILVRFSYILNNFELDPISVSKIIEVLIRICRHSPEAAQKVFESEHLMVFIFHNLMSKNPYHEGVKLLKVLSSSSKLLAQSILNKFNFDYVLKFIEMDEPAFKLKLECLEFWKTLIGHELLLDKFENFAPCFIRLLWFYVEKVNIEHGRFDFELFAGIVSLINSVQFLKNPVDINYSKCLEITLEKWLTQYGSSGNLNYSNGKAIANAMQFFTLKFKNFGVNNSDRNFLQKLHSILNKCLNGEKVERTLTSLSKYSHIIHFTNIDRDPSNLPSLGSVYLNGSSYLNIVKDDSPMPFVNSLLELVVQLSHISNVFNNVLISIQKSIQIYSNNILKVKETSCWFSRYEIGILVAYLDSLNKDNLETLNYGFTLIPYLRTDDERVVQILEILSKSDIFKPVLGIYKTYFSNFKTIKFYNSENLQKHWLYEPMAIATTEILKFLSYILKQFPNLISHVPPTLLFCHLCIVLLNSDNVFNSDIHSNLEICLINVIQNFDKLDLNSVYISEKTFYELYRDLVTEYASSSYGDQLFGKIVMLPMAQKFDLAYRKLMWSEFMHALRVVTLPKELFNFISIDLFTTPTETDESLLILYLNSLMKNVLTETRNGFIYEACILNIKKFLALEEKDERLETVIRNRINALKNENLKSRLLS